MDLEERRKIQNYHIFENGYDFLTKTVNEDEDKGSEGEINKKQDGVPKRIERKVLPGVAKRFQYLVDDVALLDSEGLFDPEYWSEGWEEIRSIEPTPETEEGDTTSHSSVWLPLTDLKNECRFGFTLGQMTRFMKSQYNSEENNNELVWGFIQGLMGEPQSKFVDEYYKIEELIETLENHRNRKLQQLSDDEIRNQILHLDLANEELVINYVRATSRPQQMSLSETQNELDIDISLPCGPEQEEFESLSLFEEIIQATPEETEQYLSLAKNLRVDYHLMKTSKARDTQYERVFQKIWELKSQTRDDLMTSLNLNKRRVTRIMNDIGTKSTKDRWKGRPPLVERVVTGGPSGHKWSTTSYGDLVGECLYIDDGVETVLRRIGRRLTENPENRSSTIFEDCISELDNHPG